MSEKTKEKPELEQIHCNFFQSMSVSLNVRYSAGVRFHPVPAQTVVSAWFQSLAQHGAHVQLVLLRVGGEDENRVRPVLARQKLVPGSKQSLNFATPSVEASKDRKLSEIVTDNLYSDEVLHPSGPARSFLYVNAENNVECLVVNVNAALWDYTIVKSVIEAFIGYMHSPRAPTENPYTKLGGWEKYIQESIKSTPEPPFLPIGEDNFPSRQISEIMPGSATTAKERRLSISLDSDTVKICQKVANENDFTMAHLGMAALGRALAEAHFESKNDSSKATIAHSIQFDPRSLLPSDVPTKYLNAVGSLSFGRTIDRNELDNGSATDWVIQESRTILEDISIRMKRGEGARKIMEIVTGQIVKEHHVLTALEWTDHGVYDTRSDEFEVELGHRFDKCPQMTVVSHIEKSSGIMKLEVQLSEDQDLEGTIRIFDRMQRLWEQVAATV